MVMLMSSAVCSAASPSVMALSFRSLACGPVGTTSSVGSSAMISLPAGACTPSMARCGRTALNGRST